MNLNTDGLIIVEKNVSDNDKLVTMLTRRYGVIKAFAKNSKNIKNKNFSAVQMFAYSDFEIYKGRDKYIINEANLKDCFFKIRQDIKKVAVCQYFSEVVLNLVHENADSENILRLLLNCMYYISNDKMSISLIKSVFEMRILSMSGYMPDLVCCKECKKIKNGKMFFDFSKGQLVCKECLALDNIGVELTDSILAALRYIIYSDFNKMFSFYIEENQSKCLSYVTETYMINCIDKKLKTLDFYNQVKKI